MFYWLSKLIMRIRRKSEKERLIAAAIHYNKEKVKLDKKKAKQKQQIKSKTIDLLCQALFLEARLNKIQQENSVIKKEAN